MLWFLIAAIAGVLAYRAFLWRRDATANLVFRNVIVIRDIIVITVIVLALCLCLSISDVEIGQIAALRLLLGFLLGLAGCYRFFNGGITISRNGILFTALGIVVFALVAPHFDRWAKRLSSVKASGVEIQLAALSNAVKIVQPDVREQFLDESILAYLGHYDETINRDIAYLKYFRLPYLDELFKENRRDSFFRAEKALLTAQLTKLEEFQTVFDVFVSPLTRCIINAIENGYSIESVRSELRPLANELTRIIALDARDTASSQRIHDVDKLQELMDQQESARKQFWDALKEMPNRFSLYVDTEHEKTCHPDAKKQISQKVLRPKYFNELPHLFVSRAFLLLFLGNDDLAFRELQKAQDNWKLDDIYSWYLMGRVSYYKGEPISRYNTVLEKMKAVARDRQKVVKSVAAKCRSTCDSNIQKWESTILTKLRYSEYIAMNMIAYGVAQDLAQNLKQAEPLRPIAEDYAKLIAKYAESETSLDEYDRDGMLDTAAFVTVVTQAERKERDEKLLKDAVAVLSKLVAKAEDRATAAPSSKKSANATLKEVRAHYTSAKSLLED